jgi:hypothetical protein
MLGAVYFAIKFCHHRSGLTGKRKSLSDEAEDQVIIIKAAI